METSVYNQEGKQSGAIKLPAAVFDVKWNGDLVHQVVFAMRDNARTPIAHVKDRSDVRGGGKKPWKQKGTGRARHGSRRSPIWIGGGITHGPSNERVYAKKINKKMRAQALVAVLSEKLRDREILFVDAFSFEKPKTGRAKEILTALAGLNGYEELSKKKNNCALIITAHKDENVYRSFGNFSNVAIGETRNLNPVDALHYKYLIIVDPEESIELLKRRVPEKKKMKVEKMGSSGVAPTGQEKKKPVVIAPKKNKSE